MRLVLLCSIFAVIGAAGCTRAATERDGGSTDTGHGVVDAGSDAPATSCTSDGQCADSFACTIDQCVVGGMCMHTPVDTMCTGAGEHCSPTMGCTTRTMTHCTTSADCDDHNFCNGDESCVINMCYASPTPRNCDDGNSCTIDSCDNAAGSCAYVTTCDAGVGHDTGPVCSTFTAPADFNGTYALAPGQSQACPGANYDVSEVTLTGSGTTVNAVTGTSGAISMSGTMTGSSFDVTGTSGTNTYHLTGSFTCRESFTGMWTATVHGFGCMSQSAAVRGVRR